MKPCRGCKRPVPNEPATATQTPCAHWGEVRNLGSCAIGRHARLSSIPQTEIFADLFKPEPTLWAPEFL